MTNRYALSILMSKTIFETFLGRIIKQYVRVLQQAHHTWCYGFHCGIRSRSCHSQADTGISQIDVVLIYIFSTVSQATSRAYLILAA